MASRSTLSDTGTEFFRAKRALPCRSALCALFYQPLALVTTERCSMLDKLGFDDTDYSVVVKHRGRPPNPWKWEIYRAGTSSSIGQSPIFFRTMAAANKAGKAALKQLLAKLNG
jgi:hypothetical protein